MATVKLLITYDIKEGDELHTKLKNEMISTYGWSKQVASDTDKKYRLPNTTLIKQINADDVEKARTSAAQEFKAACKKVGALWEKFIIVDYNGASFNVQDV